MPGDQDVRPLSPPPSYSKSVIAPANQPPLRRRRESVEAPGQASTTIMEDSHAKGRPTHHPQVAVALGIHRYWRHILHGARIVSMGPAIYWALRCVVFLFPEFYFGIMDNTISAWDLPQRLKVVELLLALQWCIASAYLAFFFTDCLMTRWLVNYTPPATIVRLVSLNMANVFLISKYLNILVTFGPGDSPDYRLLFPGWVCIAFTLTVLYHLSHRQTNIRRETYASIRVFWICSFISMMLLVFAVHFSWGEELSANASTSLSSPTERAPDYQCICNCPAATMAVPPQPFKPAVVRRPSEQTPPLPSAALEGLWEWLDQWRRNGG